MTPGSVVRCAANCAREKNVTKFPKFDIKMYKKNMSYMYPTNLPKLKPVQKLFFFNL